MEIVFRNRLWQGWAAGVLAASAAYGSEPELPRLDATAIVSGADHRGGAISPGEIVTLFPQNAGPDSMVGLALDAPTRVSTILGETRVLFDGQAAPLIYTVRGEIGAIVPFEVAGRTSSSVVVEYLGRSSLPVTVPVVPAKPAIFTQNRVGTGQAGVLNETGCCNSAANPAVRGTWVTLYATGTGVYEGALQTGSIAVAKRPSGYPRPRLPLRLTVGGKPAQISFAGAAPHSIAGLLQVNFRVPAGLPDGDAEMALSVGNAESTARATIAVRSEKRKLLLASLSPGAKKQWRARLAGTGFEVVEADDLAEASETARKGYVDLAIVDLTRPGSLDASWIRELAAKAPGMKILAMVNQADYESLRQADLIGANAVLIPGTGRAAILQRIRQLVHQRTNIYDAGPPWPLPAQAR